MLNKNQVDIIGLKPTRLNETIKDPEIHLDEYQSVRNDRNKDGGRVAFCVKDSLAYVKIKLKCDELELRCLAITPQNAKKHVLIKLV